MGRTKKTKRTARTPEFEAARSWYKMECANYCFEVVRDVLRGILNDRPSERSPNYYAMLVGIICTYARPFTYNEPVGKLGSEIVPDEFKELHKKILDIRHMLFAHADASLAIGDENYPNAVMIESDGIEPFISVPRSAIKWDALKQFLPLVEALTESTNRYRSEYVRQFVGPVLKCGKGVFRLNVVDSSSLIFVKLSEAQEIAWRKNSLTVASGTLSP
jgi:hypothetical protein